MNSSLSAVLKDDDFSSTLYKAIFFLSRLYFIEGTEKCKKNFIDSARFLSHFCFSTEIRPNSEAAKLIVFYLDKGVSIYLEKESPSAPKNCLSLLNQGRSLMLLISNYASKHV